MSEYWWKASDMRAVREEFGLTFADIGLWHDLMSRGMDDFRTDLKTDRRAQLSLGDTNAKYAPSEKLRARFDDRNRLLLPMAVARSVANSGGIRRVPPALDRLKVANLLDYDDEYVYLNFEGQTTLEQAIQALEQDRNKPSKRRRVTGSTKGQSQSRPQGTHPGTEKPCPPGDLSRDRSKTSPTGEGNTSYSYGAAAALTGEPDGRSAPESSDTEPSAPTTSAPTTSAPNDSAPNDSASTEWNWDEVY